MKHLRLILPLCIALLATAFTTLRGQDIVGFNIPHHICANPSDTISFGYLQHHNIVIQSQTASLGHSERIFLPDGRPCNGSCSYRSPVTFNSFAPGATVTSVNDIKYVRLNIEHSFIGDLYIGITCPNGSSASLMKYSNTGDSDCLSSILPNHRGWVGYNHVYEGCRLGNPYNYNSSNYHACDSTHPDNQPGTGWNYCWSNNTNSGYQYASGAGYIYSAGNQHNYRIDSSNVALGRQFYHPDQNFSSLIGCPLNGTWEITVIDGFNIDNGYIFEWELSLDATLIPPTECHPVEYAVLGPGVTPINDSTFSIASPHSLSNDTSILYTFRIINSCGDTIDTTATIQLHPARQSLTEHTACDRFLWIGHTYTSDTTITTHLATSHGCDSTATTRIVIHPSYLIHVNDTVVENQLPVSFGGNTYNNTATDQLNYLSSYSCDSTIIYSLTVHHNTTTTTDTAICSNQLPFAWNGNSYWQPANDTIRLNTHHGADSLVVLNLSVHPATDSSISLQLPENLLPAIFNNQRFYNDTSFTLHLSSSQGCDSTLHFSLKVFRNHTHPHHLTICDNLLPYTWHNTLFTHADTVSIILQDSHGADSILLLMLQTLPTYDTSLYDTTCDNHHYSLAGHTIEQPGIHTLTLSTTQGCDSILRLSLTIMPHNATTLYDTACASSPYRFGQTEHNTPGTYTHTYTNHHGCDSIATLHLTILGQGLHAALKATPEIATLDKPEIQLLDLSHRSSARQWTIGNLTSNQRDITYRFPENEDSIPVILTAYSNDGCTDTATTTLRIDRSRISLPNAFTPNQHTNCTWRPATHQITQMEIRIFNRQGLAVRHLKGLDAEWDGTSDNGTPLPQGTYVYSLRYRTSIHPDRQQEKTGTILLLR